MRRETTAAARRTLPLLLVAGLLLLPPATGETPSVSNARRLLETQPSFDWTGAAELLDNELLAGNFDALNNMASAINLEVDSQYAAATLTALEALALKDMIFTKLATAALVVKNTHSMSEGYMCTSLDLAR